PHAPLHHIKKENIGLIEVMGLFILPGRLLGELTELSGYLTGAIPLDQRPADDSPILKHYEWVKEIAAQTGCALSQAEAVEAIHRAMAVKCAAVLADAGVYKHDEGGRAGVLRFLNTIGYAET
ncbi:MAG: galactose-1-phosphate uridylyltransferase, partial [Clostridia bacterium]|nr:galactose-1-phosphate uridylyltransferase [Clostridia bacterium]